MDDVTVTFIPEPAAAGLFLLGAAVWSLRRRRSEQTTSRTAAGPWPQQLRPWQEHRNS